MASVSSTSSVKSSSIYGNRNVISGLASGLDTEEMIENAVKSYQTKIQSLQQKREKLVWQQDAYRSIITKMVGFSDKYTSYTSATNLFSKSFFNQAVTQSANGANASKVAASGKSDSEVAINRVQQLATSARYAVSGGSLGVSGENALVSALAPGTFQVGGTTEVSRLSGSMTLAYGGSENASRLYISFKESDVFKSAEDLKAHIEEQLKDQSISTNNGSKSALDMLNVNVSEDGRISFEGKAGNSVYIAAASDSLKETLNLTTGSGSTKFFVPSADKLVEKKDTLEYTKEEPLTISLDGVTKKIDLPGLADVNQYLEEKGGTKEDAYVGLLQQRIDDAFGKLPDGKSKLEVTNALKSGENAAGTNGKVQLKFQAGQEGSTFSLESARGWALGMGDDSKLTSYVNTSKKLGDLLGENFDFSSLEQAVDEDGEPVTTEAGDPLYSFKINGVEVGQFNEDTSLESVMLAINNSEAGVNVSYSKISNEFVFTAKESGSTGKIDFGGEDSFASRVFGGGEETAGQDAIFQATINGRTMTLTRSSNSIDFDGLNINLKGTFGYEEKMEDVLDEDGEPVYKTDDKGNPVLDQNGDPVKLTRGTGEFSEVETEAVTFTSNVDKDKIVDAVRSMVEDYNAMVTEIKNAYSTLPLQRSTGAYYEPLTEDEKATMTETAIENWEENAKTGLLFGDRDLSSLYQRLTSAVSMVGRDQELLKAAGITTSYSNGLTTLKFDENTLRSTLDTNPDSVRDIFTKNAENGASSNGLMAALKTPLDMYAKTTGTKGILVDKAGTLLSPTSLYSNTIQSQLDDIDEDIESWQDKMSDRIDYYTDQFSRLEQLIATMNSQSSTLSQMMGSYSG